MGHVPQSPIAGDATDLKYFVSHLTNMTTNDDDDNDDDNDLQ